MNAPQVAGRTTMFFGGGTYGGQSAIGVQMRRTSDDGSWSIVGGVLTNSFSQLAARSAFP
ncbi:YadA-like family protein [Aquirhabdus sp.]|uniref:YadA-like family protein n=1 Tax=Aquirhabdus sp. TaxID=2824160 RepID=UPI00396CC9CF